MLQCPNPSCWSGGVDCVLEWAHRSRTPLVEHHRESLRHSRQGFFSLKKIFFREKMILIRIKITTIYWINLTAWALVCQWESLEIVSPSSFFFFFFFLLFLFSLSFPFPTIKLKMLWMLQNPHFRGLGGHHCDWNWPTHIVGLFVGFFILLYSVLFCSVMSVDNWLSFVILFRMLAWNGFHGTIPTEIGSLSSLTRLILTGNHLSGPIPTEIAGLTSLTQL